MIRKYQIALVGATTPIGEQFLDILSMYGVKKNVIVAVASHVNEGDAVGFGDSDSLQVIKLNEFDFSKTEFVFFTETADISSKYIKKAVDHGCKVVDNFYHMHSYEDDVALMFAELNNHLISPDANIFANPSSIAMQVALAMNEFHNEFVINNIVISSYQSVSTLGTKAMDELYNKTKEKFEVTAAALKYADEDSYKLRSSENEEENPDIFPDSIAFNCIPCVGRLLDNGFSTEELRITRELQKLFGIDIPLSVTCVYVPTFIGDGISLNISFQYDISLEEFIAILDSLEGIIVYDSATQHKYATLDLSRDFMEAIIVSRIRKDFTKPNSFNLWLVAHNLRAGSALNAFQIIQYVLQVSKLS